MLKTMITIFVFLVLSVKSSEISEDTTNQVLLKKLQDSKILIKDPEIADTILKRKYIYIVYLIPKKSCTNRSPTKMNIWVEKDGKRKNIIDEINFSFKNKSSRDYLNKISDFENENIQVYSNPLLFFLKKTNVIFMLK